MCIIRDFRIIASTGFFYAWPQAVRYHRLEPLVPCPADDVDEEIGDGEHPDILVGENEGEESIFQGEFFFLIGKGGGAVAAKFFYARQS